MNPDTSAQERALLELIAEHRAARLAALATDTRARERAILAEAFAAARERVREAFAQERARLAETLALADARLAARRRQIAQRHAARQLATAWQVLPDALAARWADPRGRAAWVAGVLARASETLRPGGWRVDLPAEWPAAEQEALAECIATATGHAPEMAFDARIHAGIRIAAGGNTVDGTLDGLLADRDAIDARLLHFLGSPPP